MTEQEVLERYRSFNEKGWRAEPSSYQIRNRDGSKGGWVAQVHIVHDTYHELSFQPLLERDVKTYNSPEEANAIAFSLGLRWLEEHVP